MAYINVKTYLLHLQGLLLQANVRQKIKQSLENKTECLHVLLKMLFT